MVSGISPVGITQNERFLSCDTVLLAVWYIVPPCIVASVLSSTTYMQLHHAFRYA
jgi:hypothetical protein